MMLKVALHKKCPYSEFFWSVFSRIQNLVSPYSVRMRENTNQKKNSEYGHFSHNVKCSSYFPEHLRLLVTCEEAKNIALTPSLFFILFLIVFTNMNVNLYVRNTKHNICARPGNMINHVTC